MELIIGIAIGMVANQLINWVISIYLAGGIKKWREENQFNDRDFEDDDKCCRK